MEMPVICNKCGEWVELNDCRTSDLTKNLLCPSCCDTENEVKRLKEAITDILIDLENDAECTIGNRRALKKEIKELKQQINELGYDYDDIL